MNLSDFCRRITGPDTRLLPENHKLGARLVCPEYSKSVQDVSVTRSGPQLLIMLELRFSR